MCQWNEFSSQMKLLPENLKFDNDMYWLSIET